MVAALPEPEGRRNRRAGHRRTHSHKRIESLSRREREVLRLVVDGYSSARIGDLLHLSPKTVDSYRSRLMRKLNVNQLAGLIKFALQHAVTTLE